MSSGFTLIEVVIVLAVVATLAAILTPMVTKHIADARVQRARADTRTVGEALLEVQRDLGDFPIFLDGTDRTLGETTTFDVLFSPGDIPALSAAGWSAAFDGGADADELEDQLIRNAPSYPTSGRFSWRGPYVDELAPDPWGRAFLVNAENLRPAQPDAAYVLSAGPDGVVNTDFDIARTSGDVIPAGDDLLFRVR